MLKLGKLIEVLTKLRDEGGLDPELEVDMVIEITHGPSKGKQYEAMLGEIAVPTSYKDGDTVGVASRIVLLSEGFT